MRVKRLMNGQEFNHDAQVNKTITLLDGVERAGDTWHSGRDPTASLSQLPILASGRIQLQEQAVASMGESVNEVLDETKRLNPANEK